MEKIKLILFLQILSIFVCIFIHSITLFSKEKFPTEMYIIVAAITLVISLISVYIIFPIFNWIMNDN